jgi:hypothetical protein
MSFDRVARLLMIAACAVLFCTCLLLPLAVRAQTGPQCLPRIDNAAWLAGDYEFRASIDGACVRWACYEVGTARVQTNTYCGTTAELSKVGSRMQTIIRAADPLKSLQTAGARFPILPLSDPQFDKLRALFPGP